MLCPSCQSSNLKKLKNNPLSYVYSGFRFSFSPWVWCLLLKFCESPTIYDAVSSFPLITTGVISSTTLAATTLFSRTRKQSVLRFASNRYHLEESDHFQNVMQWIFCCCCCCIIHDDCYFGQTFLFNWGFCTADEHQISLKSSSTAVLKLS